MQLICLRVWYYLNKKKSRHGAHIPRSVKYVESNLAFEIAIDTKLLSTINKILIDQVSRRSFWNRVFGSACDQAWQMAINPSGASNVWALLAECTYVYSWYEWLYYWRIDTRARGEETSFYRKRAFSLFLREKDNLLKRVFSAAGSASLRDDKKTLENRHVCSGLVKSVFVSPYLVLLRQSNLLISSILLVLSLCSSHLSALNFDCTFAALGSSLLHRLCTVATLGLAWDQDIGLIRSAS